MTFRSWGIASLAIVLALGAGLPPSAGVAAQRQGSAVADRANAVAIFSGAYQCAQGSTPVTVELFADQTGRFTFGGGATPVGAYTVRVLPVSRGRVILRPMAWISQPPGAITVSVSVTISETMMVGEVMVPGCSQFSARRTGTAPQMAQTQPGPNAASPGAGSRMAQQGRRADDRSTGRPQFRMDEPTRTADERSRPASRTALTATGGLTALPVESEPAGLRNRPAPGSPQVDGPALIALARTNTARISDKQTCMLERGTAARARVNGGWDDDDIILDRDAYLTLAEGALCMQQLLDEKKPALRAALATPAAPNDVRPAVLALAALNADFPVSRHPRSLQNSVGRIGSKPGPAAKALGELGPDWGDIYYVAGLPEYQAFVRKIAQRTLQLQDPAQLQALADDLLPLFRIFYNGYSAPSVELTDPSGDVKAKLARGVDLIAEAQEFPSLKTVQELMIAQRDPATRAMLTRKAAPADWPKPQELATLFADAFYRGHPDFQTLVRNKILSMNPYSTFGSTVRWDVPKTPGLPYVYADIYTFLVNDYVPPKCEKRGTVYRCTLQLAIETARHDLLGDMAGAIGGFLTGQTVESDGVLEQREITKFQNRAYEWEEVTIDLSRINGVWRSPTVDQQMGKIAVKTSEARAAMASNRDKAMQKARENNNNMMDEWELREALEQARDVRF